MEERFRETAKAPQQEGFRRKNIVPKVWLPNSSQTCLRRG